MDIGEIIEPMIAQIVYASTDPSNGWQLASVLLKGS